jgi:phosphoribosylamine--glycine ligase
MGAYCPTPLLSAEQLAQIEADILVPTVHAMNRAKCRFTGVLYAGLMLTVGGPRVLEYNVRFGDPECQPLLMRLESDLVEIMLAAVEGRLNEVAPPRWSPQSAVCVVMASAGYPGEIKTGQEIRGLDEAALVDNVKVFHAGTRRVDGRVVTAGGRVLGVTAKADSIAAAKLQAYRAVKCIRWHGAWCRKDISDKAFRTVHAQLQASGDPPGE